MSRLAPAPDKAEFLAKPFVGVVLVMLATLGFALAEVVTKHLAASHAIPLIVAGRYLVNAVLLAVLLGPLHGAALWRTQRTGLVFLRALCLAAASLTMGLALRLMPVAETVAIIYLAPFLVMALAAPVLGEKVPLAGWIGAIAGFVGVLLIVRPGGGLDPLGVTLALVNAGFATAYMLLTRVLARSETTLALLFHTAVIGLVVFAVLVAFDPPETLPPLFDFGLIAVLGILATLGHFLFTAAYRHAPASLLAPVNYLHLVWAGLLGWLVFHHIPDAPALTGMGLVAAAGVMVALRSRG